MCYSAQIRADYTKLVREFGAAISLDEFAQLYAHDAGKQRPKTPKAMDDGFAGARTAQGQDIVAKIQQWHAEEMQALSQLSYGPTMLEAEFYACEDDSPSVFVNKKPRPKSGLFVL